MYNIPQGLDWLTEEEKKAIVAASFRDADAMTICKALIIVDDVLKMIASIHKPE